VLRCARDTGLCRVLGFRLLGASWIDNASTNGSGTRASCAPARRRRVWPHRGTCASTASAFIRPAALCAAETWSPLRCKALCAYSRSAILPSAAAQQAMRAHCGKMSVMRLQRLSRRARNLDRLPASTRVLSSAMGGRTEMPTTQARSRTDLSSNAWIAHSCLSGMHTLVTRRESPNDLRCRRKLH
jgi:hypothetical protein